MKITKIIIISSLCFIQLLFFVGLNIILDKEVHPHTIHQISSSKNIDLNSFKNENIFVSQNDIFNSYKNTFYENLKYRFDGKNELVEPNSSIKNSDYGYIFIFKFIDRLILFDFPELIKILIFHFLLHLIISFYFYNFFKTKLEKNLFLLLYVFNPIIFYVMSYPTYYFFQTIGGFVILKQYLEKNNSIYIFVLNLLLLFLITFVRSTSFGFLLAFLFIFFYQGGYKNYLKLITLISIFISYFIFVEVTGNKNLERIWHTVGLGMNAYNFSDLNLSDDKQQYEYSKKFEDKFGYKPKDFGPDNKNYTDMIKKDYFKNLYQKKFTILKNYLLNNISLFSWGYISNNNFLILTNILLGFTVLLLGIYNNFKLIFLIIICESTYTFYYPPILVYRFGSYILLSYLLMNLIVKYYKKYNLSFFKSS